MNTSMPLPTTASNWARAKVEFEESIKIKEEGYLYVYLSYENQSNNFVATKFLGRVAGPALGAVGVVAAYYEDAYDENGYTLGDKVKTGLGIGLVALSFTVAAPAVAVYALADICVTIFTGTSITDRIGNGIDNLVKP